MSAWGEISSKPTSRPRSSEFGLDLTSGLPVIQTQIAKGTSETHLRLQLGAAMQIHFFKPASQLETTTICV